MASRVRQFQVGSGKIRNLPLSDHLAGILLRAAMACNVDVHIVSGGQPPKGQGSRRTGSTRHDVGGGRMGAADVQLIQGALTLKFTVEPDQKLFSAFVRHCVAAGATGVGAGVGYMGASTIHVGGGGSAVWGGLKASDRPPGWLVEAHAAGLRQRRGAA